MTNRTPSTGRHASGLFPPEAAAFLRVKVDTLRIWRRDGRGPAYVKVGGRVRYLMEDLEQFVRGRSARPRARRKK